MLWRKRELSPGNKQLMLFILNFIIFLSHYIQGLADSSSGTAKKSRKPFLLQSRYIDPNVLVWPSSRHILDKLSHHMTGMHQFDFKDSDSHQKFNARVAVHPFYPTCVNSYISISEMMMHLFIPGPSISCHVVRTNVDQWHALQDSTMKPEYANWPLKSTILKRIPHHNAFI